MVARRTHRSSLHVSNTNRRNRKYSPPFLRVLRPTLLLIALLAVPLLVLSCLEQTHSTLTSYLLFYLLLVNIWTCVLYWHDKTQSRVLGAWRVSEKRLHACELAGGWPAAYFSQRFFQHKTQKVNYQITFWTIIAGHEMACCWALWVLQHQL